MVTRLHGFIAEMLECFIPTGGAKVLFRKYKVAPRVGTQVVRRRLLFRLCAVCPLVPRMNPNSEGRNPTEIRNPNDWPEPYA